MTPVSMPARAGNERGVALILAMFMMMALSTVAASTMFLSQTETYSSQNYRLMSQARYGAESGIQKASNYLLYTYVEPSTGGADSIANYDTAVSPVTYNGQPVVLSANAEVASNYPVAAAQTAFNNAVHGTLASGTASVEFSPYATLMSMEEVPGAQSIDGQPFTLQTWQITSTGSIQSGSRTAEVEVTATLDTQKLSMATSSLTYAAFATAATCGALRFSGGASTKSYDSSLVTNPSAAITVANGGLQSANGNVGTNGNLTESGGATINGTLSTPRVGVGSCSSGNVTAQTASGGATVTGGLVQLPQAVVVASPSITDPGAPTSNLSVSSMTTCAALGLSAPATCAGTTAGAGSGLTVTPNGATINWGNLSLSGGGKIVINGGAYNLNSVSVSGGGSITTNGSIAMTVKNSMSVSGGGSLNINSGSAVAMNIVTTATATPISLSGGALVNNTMDPANFVIQYAGTGTFAMSGGAKQAMVVYAPNATINLSGGSSIYGAVVGKTLNDSGGTTIYYDRHLASNSIFSTNAYQPGNPMLSSFSWKRF
ncbi:MAG: pilus assembly PilX N-terminal domain-containing protein [Acidobacteria bacterium]|nr:pilus assembly PilX N-terminal domain-containing protein [Acidobacteriota bacterium]